MRHLSDTEYLAIKAAFRRLIRLVGGLCKAAEITRYEKTRLHDFGSAKDLKSFPPIDCVADLEAEAGDAAVSCELARICGENGLSHPFEDIADLLKHRTRTRTEDADVDAAILEAIDDGRVSPAEYDQIIQRAEQSVSADQQFLDRCRAAREKAAKPKAVA